MALAAATQSLEFRLLGPLELRAGGENVTPRAGKQRALLALLLLRANEPVAADQLVEQLWDGKPPATALNTLQHYVSELRKLLPTDTLLTQAPGYVLRLVPEQVDLQQFEQLVHRGREALVSDDAARAAGLLDQALGLWRGPALADFAYQSWAVQEAQRLEELRLDAVENRVEAWLALGRHGELVAELQTLVAQQPLRERLRHQLMLALYRSGRQAEALEAYQRARETLVEELGIDPSPELQALYKQILNQDERLAGPAAPAKRAATNLPEPPTPLIGREQELDELKELLLRADVRLVTVTGAGGSGKTRLSLELARRLLDEFTAGVFMVELAPVSDPELFVPTVAQALGVRERPDEQLEQTLTNDLRDRDLLLLLDNFEQLLAAAAKLAGLLARTQRLRVLVTSRAVLHLSGEHEYLLSPLSLPDLNRLADADSVSRFEAVQLFNERARSVRSDFQITPDNAAAVAEICMRLDGLPLAIELAAARTRTLPPKALLQRLDQRLTLLTGGARDLPSRQQTLRGAIDWSYSLLTKPEQTLFARLSIFVGGCRIDAAEALSDRAGDPPINVLDGLGSLIENSLLHEKEDFDGEPRFLMLETIREYALEQLADSGDVDMCRALHAKFFTQLALQLEPELETVQERALSKIARELPNMRAAVEWYFASNAVEDAARLVIALFEFFDVRAHVEEPERWLEHALSTSSLLTPRTRAWAAWCLARLHVRKGIFSSVDEATGYAAQQLFRDLGDHAALSKLLSSAALGHLWQGKLAKAVEVAEEALERAELSGEPVRVQAALNALGGARHQAGEPGGVELMEQSLQLARQLGDRRTVGFALANLAEMLLVDGDYERARIYRDEALRQARELEALGDVAIFLFNGAVDALLHDDLETARLQLGDVLEAGVEAHSMMAVQYALFGAAAVLAAEDRPLDSALLWAAGESLSESQFASRTTEGILHERFLKVARDRSQSSQWRAARERGSAMSLDAAVDHARTLGFFAPRPEDRSRLTINRVA